MCAGTFIFRIIFKESYDWYYIPEWLSLRILIFYD